MAASFTLNQLPAWAAAPVEITLQLRVYRKQGPPLKIAVRLRRHPTHRDASGFQTYGVREVLCDAPYVRVPLPEVDPIFRVAHFKRVDRTLNIDSLTDRLKVDAVELLGDATSGPGPERFEDDDDED